jgi:hypothetical protein
MSFPELNVNILHNIKHTMASETIEIELTSRTPHSSTADIQPHHSGSIDSVEANNSNETNAGFSLPPTDGGKDAWLFLLSCFMMEALIWGMRFLDAETHKTSANASSGFPATYGVFQEYYSTHEPFIGSSNIAVVGTCAMVREPSSDA